MSSKKKFKYDYAGELDRRGLGGAKHLINAVILSLIQRGEYARRSSGIPEGEIDYERIDANRRAIVAEIDRRCVR